MDLKNKKISEIAQIIENDWGEVYFAAKPYLNAMKELSSINDAVGYDEGKQIVIYFLENAKQWKGETAREVKKHLRGLI